MNKKYILFKKLGISDKYCKILEKLKYEVPFPIQTLCIPEIIKNFDILGIANTGSGKTIAFILPVLEKINKNICNTQILILTPTRELAIQINNVILNFIKYINWINSITIYGGQSINLQINLLKLVRHIIIGTTGRLIDHINRKTINLSNISILIIDEVDEMLKMGFIEDVNKIISKISKDKQTLLFSATFPDNLKKNLYKFVKKNNFKEIIIKKDNIKYNIDQYYKILNSNYNKKIVLLNFLNKLEFNSILIFVNTKNYTLKLSNFINKFKYNSLYLNGDMKQYIREKTLKIFKKEKKSILITTDVISRGIDLKDIDWVINFDFPNNEDLYVHRIGRTGRAGKNGKSLTFLNVNELNLIKKTKNKNINLIPIEINLDDFDNLIIKKILYNFVKKEFLNFNLLNNKKYFKYINELLNCVNFDKNILIYILIDYIYKNFNH